MVFAKLYPLDEASNPPPPRVEAEVITGGQIGGFALPLGRIIRNLTQTRVNAFPSLLLVSILCRRRYCTVYCTMDAAVRDMEE
jgi:hypothetical protein